MDPIRNVYIQYDTSHSDKLYSIQIIIWAPSDSTDSSALLPKPQYSYDDYAQKLKERLRVTQQVAKLHAYKVKQRAKSTYADKDTNVRIFKAGDKVLLYDKTLQKERSKN